LERGILSGLSMKLTEVEFNDMLELAFRMLRYSFVPVRVVAAGVLVMATASRRDCGLIESPLLRNLAQQAQGPQAGRSLAVKAFLAELEGRKLRPEEVPGRVDDERTIAIIDALRRDDPSGLGHIWGRLDPRTLVELGFDIVPLLTTGLDWLAFAVELNARDCALPVAEAALRHASVRGSALEPLLLKAVGGPDGFREFQVAHGTSLAMTESRHGEARGWDAELALALYEDGFEQSLARVCEPTHAESWWRFALDAPPAKRRKLLKSTKQRRELLEVFEVAWADPTGVMRWLVEGSDRLQAWSELGSALNASNRLCWSQAFLGVDLVKAARVFEQLDYPTSLVAGVLEALVDDGLDDLAVEVEAKLPPGCFRCLCCDWSKLGARALVEGALKLVTALLRPRGYRRVTDQTIVVATGAHLRELGRNAAAAAFGLEFGLMLADDGNGRWPQEDANEEAFEDGESEETIEGRLFAMKLRECCVLAK
jgi:hypothetical protein